MTWAFHMAASMLEREQNISDGCRISLTAEQVELVRRFLAGVLLVSTTGQQWGRLRLGSVGDRAFMLQPVDTPSRIDVKGDATVSFDYTVTSYGDTVDEDEP